MRGKLNKSEKNGLEERFDTIVYIMHWVQVGKYLLLTVYPEMIMLNALFRQ